MAKYAVQVFDNRRYITLVESEKATAGHLSNVMDKFIAFNRTGEVRSLGSTTMVGGYIDKATRLVRFPADGAKPIVLRKGRTTAEKVAA